MDYNFNTFSQIIPIKMIAIEFSAFPRSVSQRENDFALKYARIKFILDYSFFCFCSG